MEYVRPDLDAEPSPKDMARTFVLARTALYLVARGFEGNPSFSEDAGMGYLYYIETGKTEWADGKEITDDDRNNYAAAESLMYLPSALTFERESSQHPPAYELFSQDTPWRQKVAAMLTNVALYTEEGLPSRSMQFAGPYLEAALPRIQYPDETELEDEKLLLPPSEDFLRYHTTYDDVAQSYIDSMSKVALEGIDSQEFLAAIKAFDPSTSAPNTIAGNSWNVEDMVRDVPRIVEYVPWYEDLDVHESAAYLTTLLACIEELDRRLSGINGIY